MDARRQEQLQARLDAAEGVIAQLRSDNAQMRQELTAVAGKVELGGELEQPGGADPIGAEALQLHARNLLEVKIARRFHLYTFNC